MNKTGEPQDPNKASQTKEKLETWFKKLQENKVPIYIVVIVLLVALVVIGLLLREVDSLNRQLKNSSTTVSDTKVEQNNVLPAPKNDSIKDESESEVLREEKNESVEYNTISSQTSVGESVYYGAYEQNNNLEDGKEPIQWIVLDKMDDRFLLITSKVIDEVCYNDFWTSTTWGNCSLRTWLNESFYEEAFSKEQKNSIDDTELPDKNGYSFRDKVFILSSGELKKYFTSMEDRATGATSYAEAQGVYVYTNGNCWWWVRDAGADPHYAVYVNCIGDILDYGILVFNNAFGVRPAIWVTVQ